MKQAENFVKNVLRIERSESPDTLIIVNFKDGSAVEYDIDSRRYKSCTAPMTKKNSTQVGHL